MHNTTLKKLSQATTTAAFRFGLSASAVLASVVAISPAQAVIINGSSTGLAAPSQTITFNEFTFAQNTAITNQYSSLGVSFSPTLFYNPVLTSFPNINGNRLGNYQSGGSNIQNPFSIQFSTNQSAAAFALASIEGQTIFTALLNNVVVQAFVATTSTTSSTNFYGFSDIVFNELRVNAGGRPTLIDNIQTSSESVPEPHSLAGIGIAVAFGLWLKHKFNSQIVKAYK